MNLSTRSTRTVAAVGAVVAAGTATFMAVAAGTASADEPGHCLQNVNVRAEADVNSRIVAMCEAGTQVTIGPEKEGWRTSRTSAAGRRATTSRPTGPGARDPRRGPER